MLNNKRKINELFYIFITLHLILWTLIPTITNHNLPLDTIEALAWGSNLDWGFNKHPPASAFFARIFYQIFGSQDWAYYFLSQIFVIVSFFIVWKFSNEIFKNKIHSILSILLLEGIYFYNFTTPEFNVNVCQLPFWSLTVYYSWKIFSKKFIDFKDCILLGVFAGIGFLSKYLFIYLLISIDLLFFYLIFILKDRKFDSKYYITFTIFILILIPHIIWLTNNDYITITYGLARTGFEQSNILDHILLPLTFIVKQIGIIIPFLILIIFLVKKIKFRLNFKDKKLIFLIAINVVPIILMFFTSLITGSKIRTMWMTPFYIFFGVMFIYILQNQINIKKLKSFFIVFLIIFLISPITYAYISVTKDDKRTDYPGKQIAEKVQQKWNEEFNIPINVVLGNEWNAGNLTYHLDSRPVWEGIVNEKKLNKLNKYICIDEICVGNK
tara:strand:+ start:782 stop:2104 length:1323 start_codon:yes stop_codon:yes gene_type:complete